MNIKVKNLSKRFGNFVAVDDVSFEIEDGALVALLGPSGGGKSTILRIISGLEAPDSGSVWFDGEEATQLHARTRGVGFVFQHYALFRHLTVERNVAFGLEVRGTPRPEALHRAHELLKLVGLSGLEKRHPAQLSGGQRQRVALARALAPAPKLLLLDEPFGAVDAKVREELRQWLRRLHDEMGVTSIFVTHDQDEAFAVADKVIIVRKGAVEQYGTPAQILDEPATEFVARFVGDVNVLPALAEGAQAMAGSLRVDLQSQATGPVHLVIRAHDLSLVPREGGVARVERIVTLGDRWRVHLTLQGGASLLVQLPRRRGALNGLEPGSQVAVEVLAARAYPAPETHAA